MPAGLRERRESYQCDPRENLHRSHRRAALRCVNRPWRDNGRFCQGGRGAMPAPRLPCAPFAAMPSPMTLSICVAQLNPVVGDVPGNLAQALQAAAQAQAQGCQLLVLPELFLSGPGAADLLCRPRFLQDCEQALQQLVAASAQWPQLHIVLGHPEAVAAPGHAATDPLLQLPRPLACNAASLIGAGRVLARWRQQGGQGGQSGEQRHFIAGPLDAPLAAATVQGLPLAVLIGTDAWRPELAQQARQAGARLLLALDASPFVQGRPAQRAATLGACAQAAGLPLLYANAVGGQDELVFDGHSLAVQADGQIAGWAPGFAACLWPLQWQGDTAGAAEPGPWQLAPGQNHAPGDGLLQIWQALVLATRDYVRKNGFEQVLLGLSGGLDSALVLALAVDALGAQQVHAVMMPSPYTAAISLEDSREMARRLGVRYDEISIREPFETLQHSLAPLFGQRPADATEENLQARIRGVLLMALSNKFGGLLLTTSNKSEVAMGYSTLYGDMCGGFAPLKDVYKTEAFALARWRNAHVPPCAVGPAVAQPIPERIITRPPSAELRENQTDQDSLPPYEVLDAIVRLRMEQERSADEIVAAGHPRERVEQVFRLLRISEYKRQQGAPGPKLSARSFGLDWRYPITNGYRG
ncbi:NAD+ synthase [Vandammella animalimorsus]|uniref:Glutamine-dependent NAD(+) synthetase n=2 Tax=Vandammella animalimorsus TaxID=2029117 RepID=A0A2A2AJY1_9BURK|nr:NAD+ synthase [Vandammella animalimorsus]